MHEGNDGARIFARHPHRTSIGAVNMATHNHLCPDCGVVWSHEDFDCESGAGYLLKCPCQNREGREQEQADVASSGNGIRGFLTGLLAVMLLIWVWDPPSAGAIPGWVFHLGLIAGPTGMAWLVLRYVWAEWKPDKAANDRVSRGVAGALAGALFVGAALFAFAETHEKCTQKVYDGVQGSYTCVGEFATVPGPDISIVFISVLCGLFAFWVSVKQPDEDA